ncbi:MAG: hypothetical protein ACI976_001673 [Aureispira sp.]|jgi:hypothetical protein
MYKSKLVDLLKVLNRKEKEGLKKWVQSPMHLQHKKCQSLLLHLLSKRSLSPQTCNRHQIYEVLYPQAQYKDSNLKHLANYAVKCVERFIEFLKQEEAVFFNKKNLISFFEERGLDKYVTQELKKAQGYQQAQKIQDSTYYFQQYQLEEVIFKQQNGNSRQTTTNLQSLFDNQYLAFVLDTLRYACEAITHQRLYKSEYNIPLLEFILKEIETGKFDKTPAIQLYYYSLLSLTNPENEQHFQTLQKLLNSHHDALSTQEIKSILITAINYCVQKLNNGLEKYVRAVFELYQYGLDYNILIENNQLTRFSFKNISTVAIRLGEYDWAFQFINNYTPFLAAAYQDNYACYARAKLFFATQKYDTCMELLIKVEFDDLFLNMSAKVMLLKTYYKLQYIDALEAFLASFKRFLRRKSIIAYQKSIYENMIYFTEKLISLPPNDTIKIAKLKEEIQQTNPLTEKPWLLKQLDLLNS